MTLDPFDDARLSIEEADKHIDEFEAMANASMGGNSHKLVIEHDPKAGHYVHKLVFNKVMPRRSRVVLRNAVGDLRSALDLATAACARLWKCPHGAKVYFPFSDDSESFAGTVTTRCRYVVEPVRDYFGTLRPYFGGDNELYALSQLRNEGEHWALVPAVSGVQGVAVNRPGKPQEMIIIDWPKGGINEVQLFTTPDRATDYKLYIATNVGLHGVKGLADGHSAIAALREWSRRTKGIVDEIEAICRRLKLC